MSSCQLWSYNVAVAESNMGIFMESRRNIRNCVLFGNFRFIFLFRPKKFLISYFSFIFRPKKYFSLSVVLLKKLCSKLFRQKLNFTGTNSDIATRVFVPPFGGLRGNVHGSSMARWKARGRLPIGDNWTFFASYHAWSAMSRYWSKLRCSKWGWVTLNENFKEKGASPTNEFWHQKTKVPGLSYGEKNCRKVQTPELGAPTLQTDDRRNCDGN